MKRVLFMMGLAAILASCGADGMPTRPTKSLKERLEEKATLKADEAVDAAAEVAAVE